MIPYPVRTRYSVQSASRVSLAEMGLDDGSGSLGGSQALLGSARHFISTLHLPSLSDLYNGEACLQLIPVSVLLVKG